MCKVASSSIIGFISILSCSICSAQIVNNDAVIEERAIPFGDVEFDYALGLEKTTAFGLEDSDQLFVFWIDDRGSDNYQFRGVGIAERYALFFALPGDEIAPSFVNSNVPFASNFSDLIDPEPNEILTLGIGESVAFGYWDDVSESQNADRDDNYGWFELFRSDRLDSSFGQLEILGGATAIGRGIIVGTTTTVTIPEPSTGMLVSLLATCAFAVRRKR